MLAILKYRVEIEDEEELTKVRQRGHEVLDEVDGVVVVSSSAAPVEEEYTVIGAIRGKPDETWSGVVRAADCEAAKQAALDADEQRTVVAVLPGLVEVQQ